MYFMLLSLWFKNGFIALQENSYTYDLNYNWGKEGKFDVYEF